MTNIIVPRVQFRLTWWKVYFGWRFHHFPNHLVKHYILKELGLRCAVYDSWVKLHLVLLFVVFLGTTFSLFYRIFLGIACNLAKANILNIKIVFIGYHEGVVKYVSKFFPHLLYLCILGCFPEIRLTQFSSFYRKSYRQVFRIMKLLPITIIIKFAESFLLFPVYRLSFCASC